MMTATESNTQRLEAAQRKLEEALLYFLSHPNGSRYERLRLAMEIYQRVWYEAAGAFPP